MGHAEAVRPRGLGASARLRLRGERDGGKRFLIAFGSSERYVTARLKAEESPLRSLHASWEGEWKSGRRFLVAFGSPA